MRVEDETYRVQNEETYSDTRNATSSFKSTEGEADHPEESRQSQSGHIDDNPVYEKHRVNGNRTSRYIGSQGWIKIKIKYTPKREEC